MDWTALFEMLKQVFANDPTMILLLTVGFFFLKMIWPTPEPASKQILQSYAERIRQALAAGKPLADAVRAAKAELGAALTRSMTTTSAVVTADARTGANVRRAALAR